MSEIRVYKMISGEEVIAKMLKPTDRGWEVDMPMSIMMQDQGNGTVGVGIAPFMPYAAEKKVEINASAVAAHATPADEMLAEYRRITGDDGGLVLPKQKIIGA